MSRPILKDPVTRDIVQVRLDIPNAAWSNLERHLTRFEGPHGLSLFDWPSVIATVRRLSRAKPPARPLAAPRRREEKRVKT
jgi:hypothetical protein